MKGKIYRVRGEEKESSTALSPSFKRRGAGQGPEQI